MSLINFVESDLEEACIEVLQEMGYEYKYGPDISVDGEYPERASYRDVLLKDRILDALFRINKGFSEDSIKDAYRQITSFSSAMLIENNLEFFKLLKEGIDVPVKKGGEISSEKVFLIDFENPKKNEFLVVNQFTIIENEDRRPDLVIFVKS